MCVWRLAHCVSRDVSCAPLVITKVCAITPRRMEFAYDFTQNSFSRRHIRRSALHFAYCGGGGRFLRTNNTHLLAFLMRAYLLCWCENEPQNEPLWQAHGVVCECECNTLKKILCPSDGVRGCFLAVPPAENRSQAAFQRWNQSPW